MGLDQMAFAPQGRLDHEPEKRDQSGRTPQRFAGDHSVKRCADLIICRVRFARRKHCCYSTNPYK
jgi:hypothetical protein